MNTQLASASVVLNGRWVWFEVTSTELRWRHAFFPPLARILGRYQVIPLAQVTSIEYKEAVPFERLPTLTILYGCEQPREITLSILHPDPFLTALRGRGFVVYGYQDTDKCIERRLRRHWYTYARISVLLILIVPLLWAFRVFQPNLVVLWIVIGLWQVSIIAVMAWSRRHPW